MCVCTENGIEIQIFGNNTIKESNLAHTVPFYSSLSRIIARSFSHVGQCYVPLFTREILEVCLVSVQQTGFNQMKWWKENTIILYKYISDGMGATVSFSIEKFISFRVFIFPRSFNHSFIQSLIHTTFFFFSFESKRKETNEEKRKILVSALLRIICHSL